MKSKFILMLMIALLSAACHKRKYPPELVQVEKETIYLDGAADGEQIILKVGTDGYYCYSSYAQRPDSIYMFQGDLRKYECTSCPLAFRVELSDYRQRMPGSTVNADSVFRAGSRKIIPGVLNIHTVRFVSHSNKQVSSVHWNSSSGSASDDTLMNCEFSRAGPQTVSLTLRTKGNCESTVVNRVFVGSDGGVFACGIKAITGQQNASFFSATIIGGRPPYNYRWYFGDGAGSDSIAPAHNYMYAGSYPVKLLIEDADHNVCESNYIHVAGNDYSSCSLNMSVTDAGSRNALLNGVKIQWTNSSNVNFSSDNVTQPQNSYFEIVSSQNFEPNERGEAGRLLTIRFNVLLSDGTRTMWFKSENAAIAVSYK